MRKSFRIFTFLTSFVLSFMPFSLVTTAATNAIPEPRGEIRVVESFRPGITVLGHNVLQSLFEYALDKNDLAPSLAVSRMWIDDRILEIKLRQGVRFHNEEPFDATAVKFNLDYQREHNPARGIQVYMKNLKEIQIIDAHTVRMVLDQPDALFLYNVMAAPRAGWVIGPPRYMEQVGWNIWSR
jgi:peptide/nickel transport system substrate-binding protein